jgi:hypothetical protein
MHKTMQTSLTWPVALGIASLSLAACGETPSGGVREPDRAPQGEHASQGAGARQESGHLKLIVTLDDRGATIDKIIPVATPLRASRGPSNRVGIRYTAFSEGRPIASEVVLDPRHKHIETPNEAGELTRKEGELEKGVIMIAVPLGTETVELAKFSPVNTPKPEDRIATLKLDKEVSK